MKAEWDDFVGASKNGTFLFDRNYMDYHAERFADHSLMFYLKDRLYAVLPANVRDGVMYSHQGLTYGGLITGTAARAAAVCSLFDELNAYLRRQGVTKVVYKPVPWVYASYAAEEDLYAIVKVCRARLVARDISSTIFLKDKIKFGELRRRCSRKARRAGVAVGRSNDFEAFWRILDDNLENKYGVPPVHTCAELQLLAGRFPDNIRLYAASLDERMLGGVVVYLNRRTVHTQYISASGRWTCCSTSLSTACSPITSTLISDVPPRTAAAISTRTLSSRRKVSVVEACVTTRMSGRYD